MTSIYDFTVKLADGTDLPLENYRGKPFVIVNTAMNCGLAPQFKELQSMHENGLDVLGVPCNQFLNQEPTTNEEMTETCEKNFGVTFPLTQKDYVNGRRTMPLFQFLKEQQPGSFGREIKWNFTKFLIDADGRVIRRYAPKTSPGKILSDLPESN
ncbi:glutathione peroxidase [Alkalicoccus urumqiensis]|uniref:Glutathione peroxidase n=1 Tax=Alkalicoccus urumqiensis TaxID=1548213 RepID=A0A2P6MIA1_ALKUR|nr:glutathione peroxidase [Alkalicoccus urumqiensis]PRO66011.1 glutathione peroxidase [Alkalicoccus urumqiensis]